MKLFIGFVSQTLGKWTNLTLKSIEEHKMHSIVNQTRPDMEYLKSVEKSLIYKSIWSVIFQGTLKTYQSPIDRQFSERVYSIFVNAFTNYCESSLKVMRKEHLAKYFERIYGYIIPEPPKELWAAESPAPPRNMFPSTSENEEFDSDTEESNSEEPVIQSVIIFTLCFSTCSCEPDPAWEPESVKEWRAEQEKKRAEIEADLAKQAEELLKSTSIDCFTLNDFLSYHLGKKSAEVISILERLDHVRLFHQQQ